MAKKTTTKKTANTKTNAVKNTRWSPEEVSALTAAAATLCGELNRSPRAVSMKLAALVEEGKVSADPSAKPAASAGKKEGKTVEIKKGRWASEEAEQLTKMANKYVPMGTANVELMAKRLNRSPNAVIVKLTELYPNPRSKDKDMNAFMKPLRVEAHKIMEARQTAS